MSFLSGCCKINVNEENTSNLTNVRVADPNSDESATSMHIIDTPTWVQEMTLVTTDGHKYNFNSSPNVIELNENDINIKIIKDGKIFNINLTLQDIDREPSMELLELKSTKEDIMTLDNEELLKLKPFAIEGGPYRCKILPKDVYDGDTVKVAIDIYKVLPQFVRLPVRFFGIDTPEIRLNWGIVPKTATSKDKEKESKEIKYARHQRESHIAFAKKARDALRNYIDGKTIEVTFDRKEKDKYGRGLGTISVIEDGNTEDINQWMIKQGFAKLYNGGKKEQWIFNINGDPEPCEDGYICVSDSESRSLSNLK